MDLNTTPQTTTQGAINNTDTPSTDSFALEIQQLAQKINQSQVPTDIKEKIALMIERLQRIARYSSYSTEFETVSKYIQWVTQIPWEVYTSDNLDIARAKQVMDTSHYGMDPIKNMILDYLAVMKMQASSSLAQASGTQLVAKYHAPVFCFVGLQGVGKTSIAKSIATALGRKFVRIPMGALGSVRELRGTPRTSTDADPGLIIKSIVRAGTMNPVVLLDEIDKTSGHEGLRSDMMAFLLEILDPEQNSHFTDYYVDSPINLSQVFFITTANTTGTISTALLDRLEVIRFTSYSDEEKIIIGTNYILPKVLKGLGLSETQVVFQQDVWPHIVRPLGFDAGIRQLERNITKICRSAVREIVENGTQQIVISPENIRKYLPIDVAVLN